MYLSIINDVFQGLIMGNLRVLPPALKDIRAYTFLLKRSNIGRMDATTRSFHGVSGGCCDIIIPSVYIASVSVSTQPRESRCYARTHTRAFTAGRAARNTGSTGIKAPSLEALAGAMQRGAARPIRVGSHEHVHASAGTRAESPSRSPLPGQSVGFDVAAGLLPSPTRIPLYTSHAPLFLSSLSFFLFLPTYRSIVIYYGHPSPFRCEDSMCSLFPHSRNILNISYGYLINDAIFLGCFCDIIWIFLSFLETHVSFYFCCMSNDEW